MSVATSSFFRRRGIGLFQFVDEYLHGGREFFGPVVFHERSLELDQGRI
jgi:hypothetical protein